MTAPLLSDFTTRRAEVGGVVINYAIGGHGPPVLMLHGFPETHVAWHLVAPALATDHTVVLPDLRGYGDSDKPTPDPANEASRIGSHQNAATSGLSKNLAARSTSLGVGQRAPSR